MKLIVAGSRSFRDYATIEAKVDSFLAKHNETAPIIISGGATGADYLGEVYAANKGYKVEKYYADWKTYGKAAGPIRNKVMAETATACIVFWDGTSRGSKNMIRTATDFGLLLEVVRI
jgi:hypothetical protein